MQAPKAQADPGRGGGGELQEFFAGGVPLGPGNP